MLTLAFSFTCLSQTPFSSSALNGVSIVNPSSLQFGPDGRLYVSQGDGTIKAFTVVRNGANNYSVTATETISLIHDIPNHNDDGTLNPSVVGRETTGILVKGTAANPIIYASSSDVRQGYGGSNPDTGQDTNSGIISRLTWNGTVWSKLDLVRGLPRSKTSHATNGVQVDEQTNTLYVAQGGMTNAGSPAAYSAHNCEYALSGGILSVNLTAIDAMPTQGSGNSAFKYDLPTVDDPTRPNNPDGSDPNDPFGGNHGLNQAKLVPGGPVQVYGSGLRNPYDLLITKTPGKDRRLYTIDNGPDDGIGGLPSGSGCTVTNNYDPSEPGGNSYNSREQLHYIGNLDTYQAGSFYGGHPNPIRANPSGAGLYTDDGTTAVWRTSTTGPNPLPADWPPLPVAQADCRQGDYLEAGTHDNALLTFDVTPQGFTEYTASNFNSALKGVFFAAAWDGQIVRINLSADGTSSTNAKSSTEKLNLDPLFASNLPVHPLDITAEGDNDPFPGTMWLATYVFGGAGTITVYEPQNNSGNSGQAVTSYTLVNADNGQDIQPLNNGASLNLSTLPTKNLNVRANTNPATVGSVVFTLGGIQSRNQTENNPPYALFGDNGTGTYFAWTPPAGSYTLNATPFSGASGAGTAGTALTISFSVVNPVQLVSVVSSKIHGSISQPFNIPLPLTGPRGIECRVPGNTGDAGVDYKLIFTFVNTLTSVGAASVTNHDPTSGGGTISSNATGSDTHQYIVNLTGVTNAQYITVTLSNTLDAANNMGDVSLQMGVLLGDATADGSVNSADIGQTKSQSGHAVTSSNFREDVTVDGSINSADIGLVKSKSGTALPSLP